MGNLQQANSYLGYHWEVEGKVLKGRAVGRELGYPTANLHYNYTKFLLQMVFMQSWVKIEGEKIWRKAAISTGYRPHYEGKKKNIRSTFTFVFW